jgi:hypothetical protein
MLSRSGSCGRPGGSSPLGGSEGLRGGKVPNGSGRIEIGMLCVVRRSRRSFSGRPARTPVSFAQRDGVGDWALGELLLVQPSRHQGVTQVTLARLRGFGRLIDHDAARQSAGWRLTVSSACCNVAMHPQATTSSITYPMDIDPRVPGQLRVPGQTMAWARSAT